MSKRTLHGSIILAMWVTLSGFEWPHVEVGGPLGEALGELTNPLKPHVGLILGTVSGGLPPAVAGALYDEYQRHMNEKEEEIEDLSRQLDDLRQQHLQIAQEMQTEYHARIIAEGRREDVEMSLDHLKGYFNDYLQCLREFGHQEMSANQCLATYVTLVKNEYQVARIQ